jgi:hypothetical protein
MSKIEADFDKRQKAGEKVLATAGGKEPAELTPFNASPITPKAKN